MPRCEAEKKIFIANIILLVVLLKCRKVLTNTEVIVDATVNRDIDEPKNCLICLEEVKIIDCKLPCCSGTFHKKCLDTWLAYGVISCPHCNGNPLKGIRICLKCKLYENEEELVKTKCCNRDLCKYCIEYEMKTKCLCGEYLVKGITFDPVRLCSDCKRVRGRHTISSRCPHVYCKRCFKDMRCCIYCDEKRRRKYFNLFFKCM
ncbi:uncharacterized protein LOC126897403 isoform X2 [Daktulosphaira vitifoliae]|uniref:uncharacterized protein LOC126897403 isoform X2 n=1 Tax=Daktulosphaira vitifoliae TaxID=58002 RepID=UPI0021AA40C1|nr:uncharacterized protein LOC126897403 isoform X2 [Daktulosphaira vitifoliae]